ncbi:hypothetical protein MBRA1_002929 [Malassezia brasiliensis]|uniref:Protein SMG7 n=1 Tax=Malassezia brasiliensis TaxID=1821822 RepID=A0AAF0IPJ8_9BASI|nr:hypothetical protein MBRA1_002929 [Malassezia brasiliensis]
MQAPQSDAADADAARAAQLRHDALVQKQRFDSVLRFTQTGTARPGPAPFDMEVQIARDTLRRTYVSLLFTCPWAREAHNADVLAWNHTTYAVIAAFREQIARLEKDAPHAASKRGAAPKSERRSAKMHEWERARRDFRRFLDTELVTWERLAVQLVRVFALRDARPVLHRLHLRDTDMERQRGASGAQGGDASGVLGLAPHAEPLRAEQHHQLLETLQRILTFCGDLVRYREQYTVVPTALAARRTQHAKPRASDFTRALALYHEAQLLLPDHGNPANQLAVVATCMGDTLGAAYQYYRALCVAVPFTHARTNLEKLLDKALHTWDGSAVRTEALRAWRHAALVDTAAARAPLPMIGVPWASEAEWLDAAVLLHAMLAQRAELDCAALVSDALTRHLLTLAETQRLRAADYLRLVVSAQCAVWLGAQVPAGAPRRARAPLSTGAVAADAARLIDTAAQTLRTLHLVGLLAALWALARHELGTERRTGLARLLPALRIASKWMRGQAATLDACVAQSAAAQAQLHALGLGTLDTDGRARIAAVYASVPARVHALWATYADAVNLLPTETHGAVRHLPEDADLGALEPLRATMQPVHGVHGVSEDAARCVDLRADAEALAAHGRLQTQMRDGHVVYVAADEVDDPVAMAMHAMDTHRDRPEPGVLTPASTAVGARHDSAGTGAPVVPASTPWSPSWPWGGAAPPAPAAPAAPPLLFGGALPGAAPTAPAPVGAPVPSIWSHVPTSNGLPH